MCKRADKARLEDLEKARIERMENQVRLLYVRIERSCTQTKGFPMSWLRNKWDFGSLSYHDFVRMQANGSEVAVFKRRTRQGPNDDELHDEGVAGLISATAAEQGDWKTE